MLSRILDMIFILLNPKIKAWQDWSLDLDQTVLTFAIVRYLFLSHVVALDLTQLQ